MKIAKRTAPAAPSLRQVSEPERLEALRSYEVLDTEPEQSLNDLVQLSAFICGTPMSLVSLIDEERQWFKARVGLKVTGTPREHAFCQYAMLATDVYEVPDAANCNCPDRWSRSVAVPPVRAKAIGAPRCRTAGHYARV